MADVGDHRAAAGIEVAAASSVYEPDAFATLDPWKFAREIAVEDV
jgi:hypothetical protein